MVRKPDWRPPDGDIAPLTAVLAQLHLPELKGTIFKLCFVLWCLSSGLSIDQATILFCVLFCALKNQATPSHGSGYTFKMCFVLWCLSSTPSGYTLFVDDLFLIHLPMQASLVCQTSRSTRVRSSRPGPSQRAWRIALCIRSCMCKYSVMARVSCIRSCKNMCKFVSWLTRVCRYIVSRIRSAMCASVVLAVVLARRLGGPRRSSRTFARRWT
jgi:hypothetical protein